MISLKSSAVIGICMVVLWSLSHPLAVFACSCAAASTSEQFDNATTVFVGTVANVSEKGAGKEVTFANVHTWKGNAQEGVTVQTGQGDGDCGFDFEIDREYIVFGFGVNTIQTSTCSGTQLSTEAEMQDLNGIAGMISSPRSTQAEDGANLFVVLVPAVISFIAGLLTMYGIKTRSIRKQ